MAVKKITLKNFEIVNIVEYMNSENYWQNRNDNISGKLSWIIRKNRKKLGDLSKLIAEGEEEINNDFRDNGKIIEQIDPETNEPTGQMLVDKPYEEEYINLKQDLFNQSNEVEIEMVDAEMLFNYNMKDIDWEMMAFMIDEDPTAEEEYNNQVAPVPGPTPVPTPAPAEPNA